MIVALPTPVLSVAADAVRDLDGGEALPGLWTLFTKCKESLRDGRRLENMCWRLWYREMKISSGERYESTLDSNSEKWFIEADGSAYRPPTPEEVAKQVLASQPNGLAPTQAPQTTDRLTCVTSTRPSPTRRLSSVSHTKKAKPISSGVGKIICDLLPQSLPPPEEMRRAASSWRTASTASEVPPPETCPLKCDLPTSDVGAKRSSLPTPSTEDNESRVHPHILQPNENFPEGPTSPDPVDSGLVQLLEAQDPLSSEVPALTIVDTSSPPAPLILASNLIHSSPESYHRDPDPSSSTTLAAPHGLTQPPPRLIIVNPTPNPTPHPTPPATPVLPSVSSQFILTTGVHVTAHSGNQHLIPPPIFHMAPVLPVVPGGLAAEQSLIVHGHASTTGVAHTLITAVAETGAPRMQREEMQVPLSPALTEEALVPPQPDMVPLNPIDREQLHHPLTIQTKIETVTSKRSSFLRLVPSSPSVIAHIFGGPPSAQEVTESPTKSIFAPSAKDSTSVDSPTKKSGKGSPRPREIARRQSNGGGKPTPGVKKISRANSTGNVAIATTTSSGTQSRSGSRSRSREGHGPGLGLGGGALTMTRTTSASGTTRSRSKVGAASRVARLGTRKTFDKERERSKSKDKVEEKDDDKDTLKRPTFNIGSNSDEGSGIGSKSVGSGSEVSGAVTPFAIAVRLSEVKEEEVKVEEGADVKKMAAKTEVISEEALEALLPQQQRRIVLATSESDEYETESDDWSSEDMSAEDTEVVKSVGSNAQRSKPQTQPQQPQPQPPQPQPPPPPPLPPQHQRTRAHPPADDAPRHKQQHHVPHHPHAAHIEKLSHLVRNAKRQSLHHGKAHMQSIEQAALEAQRQRDMFAKIPPTQNISRTTSVGLLTQLMNPDPQIFPPNHPYRRGLSTGEIRGGQGHIRLHAGLAMTGSAIAAGPAQANANQFQAHRPAQQQQPQPAQRNGREQGQGTLAPPVTGAPTEVKRHVSAPHAAAAPAPGMMAPGLKPSKSSAAGPVASQVLVGSVRSKAGVGENGVLDSQPGIAKPGHHPHARDNARPAGGYRPRARPQDAELEEESESEDERGIQLSKSVAQEKLRALAERRGIRPNRRVSTDDAYEPAWAQQQQQNRYHPRQHSHLQPPPGPARTHSTPAPIPPVLSHPYNLPLTALPTTPRTTRLHMMQTEMSESLRRNLLWERRVSKNNILGFRRTASSGGGPQGNVLNGLRPLATNEPPNVVHLSAKGTTNDNTNGNAGGAPAAAGAAGQESSTRAFSRNRSWAANDYHYAGW